MRQSLKHIARILAIVLMSLSANTGWAQPGNPSYSFSTHLFVEVDMQSIALIDIETNGASTDLTMNYPTPTEAGELPPNPLVSDNSTWLNYSSAVRDVSSRSIQASISYGNLPAGLYLKLTPSSAGGSGGGTLGTPIGSAITLSSSPQNIITGIRGCYTGNGPYNGHQLTFELYYNSTDIGSLEDQSVSVTVLYTIIDN